MADAIDEGGLPPGRNARWAAASEHVVRDVVPPLLFGLRLWASVCLALYVAFWLELDNPFWAGTSAAIVCQPQLGASLRKGWFRMIGTVVGAVAIVVLTASFPQDPIAFLGLLALWCALCAFAATVLRNFAAYAAALAGYTAAIIAADNLGATGGASPNVFLLAVWRASEIWIGIICAGIVLAGTDLGGARRRLAALFADLAAEITGRFTGMLTLVGPQLPDTRSQRREFTRRVIALDPVIDQAIGESSALHYHSPLLQGALHGLFTALEGWRGVATHLRRLADNTARQEAETILRSLPPELRSAPDSDRSTRWMVDPIDLRRSCEGAVQTLLSLPAGSPSRRLLADGTAKLLTGILYVLDGLALLVDAPGRPLPARAFQLTVPDWLPALVNAGRAFIMIGAVAVFWIVTEWPNGAFAITFTAIVILLLSPRGEQAYAVAMAFTLGTAGSVLCAAIIKFAVLPQLETFPAFCMALGVVLIPVGFGMAKSQQPAVIAVLTALGFNFVPLLQPMNPMSYDLAQFYNFGLAVFVGCATGAFSFRLLPPLPPAMLTRRLLASALRDLRRLAIDPEPTSYEEWESRMYGRLAALPDEAKPLQRARLLAALSVGNEIIHLRDAAAHLGAAAELDAVLAALAQGNTSAIATRLARLDQDLASLSDGQSRADLAMRARANILGISEALAEHPAFFGSAA